MGSDMSKQRWRTVYVVSVIFFSSATVYVNKYVLSILKFTYPTVYLSWQTGSMAFLLFSAHLLGYIQLTSSFELRSVILPSLPSLLAFVAMIYTGSRALSHLSIPVFSVIFGLSYWVSALYNWAFHRRDPSYAVILHLSGVTVSYMILTGSDPWFDFEGYRWMLAHSLFQGLYAALTKDSRLQKIKGLDRAFCEAVFSVIVLSSLSILSGELYIALEFPFLHHGKFHLGCLFSAVFGCLSVLSTRWLSDFISSSDQMEIVTSMSRVFLVLGSFFFFEASLTVFLGLSVLLSLTSTVFCSYATYTKIVPLVDHMEPLAL